jgi:predicted patatin/cPLA2 family phospholipase
METHSKAPLGLSTLVETLLKHKMKYSIVMEYINRLQNDNTGETHED